MSHVSVTLCSGIHEHFRMLLCALALVLSSHIFGACRCGQIILGRLPDGRCLQGGCVSQRMEILRRCLRHDPEHALVRRRDVAVG